MLILSMSCSSQGQKAKDNVDIIGKISQVLIDKYIDRAIAVDISDKLLANQKLGKYDSLHGRALLSSINLDIHSVYNDRHIQLVNSKNTKKLPWNKSFILDIKILEGNMGYLRFSHFPEPDGKVFKVIASAFDLLKNTDGIIIDLSNNGGGIPM